MFTSMDKALIAGLTSIVFLVNNLAGWDFGIGPEAINWVVGALSPVLLYFWPNAS